MRFTIDEIVLMREALRIAASRHETQARFAERRKVIRTVAELDHRVKAERMHALRAKLKQVMA
jgi:hypothetical protein